MRALSILVPALLGALLVACGSPGGGSETPGTAVSSARAGPTGGPSRGPAPALSPTGAAISPDPAPTPRRGAAVSCNEEPVGRVELPADDGPHEEATEWWYWTGYLQTEDGRWFGFEWAFFIQEALGLRTQMVHHAITDRSAGVFAYDVAFSPYPPRSTERGFDLEVGAQTAEGSGGEDRLHGEAGAYGLDLELRPLKPAVFQHGDGHADYEFGGYTYYYSRPRMEAKGTLTIEGEPVTVSGTAWFDHQWGALAGAIDTGWDWFGIQLDGDREIMVFSVRVDGAEALAGGTYVDAGCASTELGAGEVEIHPLGEWTSPHTGCTYPAGWTLRVGDLDLTILPVMGDQELDATIVRYWEGMSDVTGDATGRAYVELSGYCR